MEVETEEEAEAEAEVQMILLQLWQEPNYVKQSRMREEQEPHPPNQHPHLVEVEEVVSWEK